MKKVLVSVFFLAASLFIGCNNNTGGGTDPFGDGGNGDGGGNTGNVTFTVSLVQDNQQQYYFEFKPSTEVYITQIVANCAAAGVTNETVAVGDVYSSTAPVDVGPVTGLQVGQQWTFTTTGNIGNQQGTAFTATSNFTVQ